MSIQESGPTARTATPRGCTSPGDWTTAYVFGLTKNRLRRDQWNRRAGITTLRSCFARATARYLVARLADPTIRFAGSAGRHFNLALEEVNDLPVPVGRG